MALYLIEYDVRSKNHDYDPLYKELTQFNAVRVLKSLWCFRRLQTNVRNLRDHFKTFVHADDGLCVVEVDEAAWATFNAEGTPKDLG